MLMHFKPTCVTRAATTNYLFINAFFIIFIITLSLFSLVILLFCLIFSFLFSILSVFKRGELMAQRTRSFLIESLAKPLKVHTMCLVLMLGHILIGL